MDAINNWVSLSTDEDGLISILFGLLTDLAALGGNVSALLGLL